MIALSIRQPWAWFIVRPDLTNAALRAAALARGEIKIVENRMRRTRYRGRMLVHASKGCTRAEYVAALQFAKERCGFTGDLPPLEQLERGGVVDAVTLVDCVDSHPSPWFIGHESGGLGLVLSDARPLPFFPCRGQLSLFEVRLSPDLARLAT